MPDVVEMSPRLVICGFPGGKVPNAYPDRSLRALDSPARLRQWIEQHFAASQFVVWNLSGLAYDYEMLGGKVVVYSFPAHPVPPLDALVEIATSVHDWLEADGSNVAILHDISGRRSAVVGACAQQLGNKGRRRSLDSIVLPLGHVGRALVPTQHRFFKYFCACLNEQNRIVLKRAVPLVLARVIVNGIPDFGLGTQCRPVLRVLDAKSVAGGTAPGFSVSQEDLSFSLSPVSPCPSSSEQGPFTPTTVTGDVLLRVYHARADTNELVTMFAVGFHTSFVTDMSLRFAADEIDGAVGNANFPADFFIDLFFSAASSSVVPVHPKAPPQKAPSEDDSVGATLDEINQLLGDESLGMDSELDDSDLADLDA